MTKCKEATSRSNFNSRFIKESNGAELYDYYWFECPKWDECCCPEHAASLFQAEERRCK